jgi:hypothetical protein
MESNECNKALEYFNKALEIKNDDTETIHSLVECKKKLGVSETNLS